MKNLMKCLIILLIVSLIPGVAAFAGVSPLTEMESLRELNEAADVNLQLPGVMGVTEVSYVLISGDPVIAELNFQVNGTPYCLRASGVMECDISGVYLDSGRTAFEDAEPADFAVVLCDSCKLARWMNISGQYVLTVYDEGWMDEETFRGIAEEMAFITNPYQPAVLLEGLYYDSCSQRAHAEVTALEEGVYAVEIHWADSAAVDYVWNMTVEAGEDGLLYYSDCELKKVTTAEDGSQTELIANLIPDGYFEYTDGVLSWTGAAEENCRSCVFVWTAE
ncbi:MAG: hypothetical protein CW338_07555 [Clostridiales bacterium]|nr:hypothetical protein [Clostridiales bacterium]